MNGTLNWLEKCPLPLAVVELDGTVIYWSAGAEWLFGFTWEQAVGRLNCWQLAARPGLRFGLMRQLLSRGHVEGASVSLRHQTGAPRNVRVALGPLCNAGGNVVAFLVTFGHLPLEATSRSQAAASSSDSALVSSEPAVGVEIGADLDEAILLEDARGHMVFVSRRAADLLGTTPEPLLGAHWSTLVTPESQAVISKQTAALRCGEEGRYQVAFRRPSGEVSDLLIHKKPLFAGGEYDGCLVSMTEVVALRRLDAQRIRAGEADTGAVLANSIGHDLSNLLATLLPQSELLAAAAERSGRLDLAAQARKIAELVKNGECLARQIGMIGQDHDRHPEASCDIHHELLQLRSLIEKEFNGVLTIDPLIGRRTAVPVALQAHALQQIVIGLALHSRQALSKGSQIAFELRRSGDRAMLTLRRIGSSAGRPLREVLAPLFATDAPQRTVTADLSLVIHLLERHGIEIAEERASGAAGAIRLWFPRGQVENAKAAPIVAATGSRVTTAKILIVDDDAAVAATLVEALKHLGHDALAVGTAQEAIELLRPAQGRFELAVIDGRLPDADGTELIEWARGLDPLLKTVLCTGRDTSGMLDQVVLHKPFTLVELQAVVQAALREEPALV